MAAGNARRSAAERVPKRRGRVAAAGTRPLRRSRYAAAAAAGHPAGPVVTVTRWYQEP
jgi:hypothetical protein